MTSEEITPDNVVEIEWDEEHFKYCTFSDLKMEGQTICSDFVGCTFEKIDWYWGLFTGSNFIDCRFNECTFAGTAFPDTRFIDCKLIDCNFIADNLASPCSFENGVAYGCTIVNCTGFDLSITGAAHHLGSVT
jgi:uncharacterized protein YjbI with pentapeptide repeats